MPHYTACSDNYQRLQETRSFNRQGHFHPTSANSTIFVEFIKHMENIRCYDSLHFHSHDILYLLTALTERQLLGLRIK